MGIVAHVLPRWKCAAEFNEGAITCLSRESEIWSHVLPFFFIAEIAGFAENLFTWFPEFVGFFTWLLRMLRIKQQSFRISCWLPFCNHKTRLPFCVNRQRHVWDSWSYEILLHSKVCPGSLDGSPAAESFWWNTGKVKEIDRFASDQYFSSACIMQWSSCANCSDLQWLLVPLC